MVDSYHESRCPGDDPSLVESAAGAFCMKGIVFVLRDRVGEARAALDEAARPFRTGDVPEPDAVMSATVRARANSPGA